jgi:glycosyltransferase involved in cell wall biosynthesis
MEELGGDACLYASPNEVDEIANHLKQLYRDEQLQASLKAKGLEQAAKYNWERTTNAFWEVLVQATTS